MIGWLLTSGSTEHALRELTKQPGLGLVMASKIYRFCSPHIGAAVDRHSSYFFNSYLCVARTERRESVLDSTGSGQTENTKRAVWQFIQTPSVTQI